ncbi:RHS repeat-associated core domain-containing protein [Pseudomonas xanthosomatis]|uniref:RHS repeat-associated core domain-containing protein n=1 Tax=Pseudomonas xanthosomatis TaxID=2842356 RepID=UPI003516C924
MKKQVSTTHFSYQNGKLVTVSQAGQHRAIFRNADVPLAEQVTGQGSGLLEVDHSGSVLGVSADRDEEELHCYSTYGYNPSLPSSRTTTGLNGERLEAAAAGYLLGNGYRLYHPALMRFLSPDSLSPFGAGGISAYAYCHNDPIGKIDPSGHLPTLIKPLNSLWKGIKNHFFGRTPKSQRTTSNTFVKPQEARLSLGNESPEQGRNIDTQNKDLLQRMASNERYWLQQLQKSDARDLETTDLSTVAEDVFEQRLASHEHRKLRIATLQQQYELPRTPQSRIIMVGPSRAVSDTRQT